MPGSARAEQKPSPDCQAYISKVMKECQIPGLAVAVVSGDDVAFLKGYGVKRLGRPGKVDAHTVFQVGSTTKAFTSCLIGMLVDQEKMSWDGRVTDYLPGFQLFDPYPTREVRVRDLLCHRTGVPTTDFLWYFSDLDSQDILRRVRYVKPTFSFRTRWQYQNVMYLAAGECAAKAAGMDWHELLQKRIFEPLKMSESGSRLSDLKKFKNVAYPHAYVNGRLQPVEFASPDPVAPAGSIVSTASDMARWLSLHLSGGKCDGKQLVSKNSLEQMYTPEVNIPVSSSLKKEVPGACRFRLYALGWIAQEFFGEKCLFHTGGIGGMRSFVAMVPAKKTGVVVLANSSFCAETAPSAIGLRILGDYLDKPSQKLADSLISLRKTGNRKKAAGKKLLHAGIEDKKPDLALAQYAGAYKSKIYGSMKVAVKSGHLVMSLGSQRVADLESLGHNTFKVGWRNPLLDDDLLTFCIGSDGKPRSVDLEDVAVFTP